MATEPISSLPAMAATVDFANDIVPMTDVSDTSSASTGTTKRPTPNQLRGYVATPASAGATGTAGQWSYDANFLYMCVATDTWIKVPQIPFGAYAQGDMLYASSTTALATLAKNTSAIRYISNTGASNNPGWALISLSQGVTGQLGIANGGTGQASAGAAFDVLSPNTTLGDMIYENATPSNARLAGNTTTTKKFLSQTGNGSISAAPVWDVPVTSAVAGTGIGVSGATGAVTITNSGVTSNVAGTGISVSGATGAVTIGNTGVTSIVAGTNVTISGATGAVTINASGGGGGSPGGSQYNVQINDGSSGFTADGSFSYFPTGTSGSGNWVYLHGVSGVATGLNGFVIQNTTGADYTGGYFFQLDSEGAPWIGGMTTDTSGNIVIGAVASGTTFIPQVKAVYGALMGQGDYPQLWLASGSFCYVIVGPFSGGGTLPGQLDVTPWTGEGSLNRDTVKFRDGSGNMGYGFRAADGDLMTSRFEGSSSAANLANFIKGGKVYNEGGTLLGYMLIDTTGI